MIFSDRIRYVMYRGTSEVRNANIIKESQLLQYSMQMSLIIG